jgi:hypothetical protein
MPGRVTARSDCSQQRKSTVSHPTITLLAQQVGKIVPTLVFSFPERPFPLEFTNGFRAGRCGAPGPVKISHESPPASRLPTQWSACRCRYGRHEPVFDHWERGSRRLVESSLCSRALKSARLKTSPLALHDPPRTFLAEACNPSSSLFHNFPFTRDSGSFIYGSMFPHLVINAASRNPEHSRGLALIAVSALHRRLDCFPLAMRQEAGKIPPVCVQQAANVVRIGVRIQFAGPFTVTLRSRRDI